MKGFLILLVLVGPSTAMFCWPWQFKCDNGNCLPQWQRCNGVDDCGGNDLSDELNCPCEEDQWFRCDNGRCIKHERRCSGIDDCGDLSGEIYCPCDDGFRCDNGMCIDRDFVCDGWNSCKDWSDESEEACRCDNGGMRCPPLPGSNRPGDCLPPEFICDEDGIWDCYDGSDQANCTDNHGRAHLHSKLLREQAKL